MGDFKREQYERISKGLSETISPNYSRRTSSFCLNCYCLALEKYVFSDNTSKAKFSEPDNVLNHKLECFFRKRGRPSASFPNHIINRHVYNCQEIHEHLLSHRHKIVETQQQAYVLLKLNETLPLLFCLHMKLILHTVKLKKEFSVACNGKVPSTYRLPGADLVLFACSHH